MEDGKERDSRLVATSPALYHLPSTIYHLPSTIYHLRAALLPCGSLLPALHLHRERVARGARTEHPADDDSDQQHGGDEDEVRRAHLGHGRCPDGKRRLTSASSRSTLSRRRHSEST